MMQKVKFVIGLLVFIMLITGAVFAYNTLRKEISPDVMLNVPSSDVQVKSSPDPTEESYVQAETDNQQATDSQEDNQNIAEEPEEFPAIDFTAMDKDGNFVKLSDMIGKPIVLNFWASWCPPCKAEMPEFDNLYKEMGDDIVFMMVNLTDGQKETKEKAEQFINDGGFSFPVYFDTEQEAAYNYGISSIPVTIFIDKNGIMVTGAQGQLDADTIRHGISFIQN